MNYRVAILTDIEHLLGLFYGRGPRGKWLYELLVVLLTCAH